MLLPVEGTGAAFAAFKKWFDDPIKATCYVDTDASPLADKSPLLLVHGIHGKADDWASFINYFNSAGDLSGRFKIYRFNYTSDIVPVKDLGALLGQVMLAARSPDQSPLGIGSKSIVILAHSMGGLVARSFLREAQGNGHWGDRVLALITLGTPHHGTPLANNPYGTLGCALGMANAKNEAFLDHILELLRIEGPYDQPNRRDMWWDNYNYDPKSPAGGCWAKDGDAWLSPQNTSSINSPTSSGQAYDSKLIIAYAGALEDSWLSAFGANNPRLFTVNQFVDRLANLPGSYIDKYLGQQHNNDIYDDQFLRVVSLFIKVAVGMHNDGFVPDKSAWFDGVVPISRTRPMPGYNHREMRDSKASPNDVAALGKDYLFTTLSNDLVHVVNPPLITQGPVVQPRQAFLGQSVTLTVTGDPNGALSPLTYQWYKDRQAITASAGTSATLTLPSVSTSDVGDYYIVVGNGVTSETSKTVTVSVLTDSIVQKPIFRPDPGTYPFSVTVSIESGTADVRIYYTTDNSTPTTAKPLYTGPIKLTASAPLKAIAVKGTTQSGVQSGDYTVQTSGTKPVITAVNGGNPVSATGPQWITIDGSGFMPDLSVGVINLSANTPAMFLGGSASINFVSASRIQIYLDVGTATSNWGLGILNPNQATSDGFGFSVVASSPGSVTLPSFNPPQGPYPTPISVQIANNTPGSVIYFTTDGTDPDQTSQPYVIPVPVSTGTTVKARAYLNGAGASGVVPATYTIAQPVSATVRMTINPSEVAAAGARWRVNGGSWQASGAIASGISVGDVIVDFKPLSSWAAPAPILLTVSAGSFNDLAAGYSQGNHPPNRPQVQSPGDGTPGIPRTGLTLNWQGSDPDANDYVQYALLFGSVPNPGPILPYGTLTGSGFISYTLPYVLEPGQTYYWQVVAKDSHGAVTNGPVWQFTTANSVPDLAAQSLTITGTVAPGATVTATVTVANIGDYVSDGIAYVRFYLSSKAGAKEVSLTAPAGQVPPAALFVPPLAPGESQTITYQVTLAGLPAGTSYLDAWVDSGPAGPYNEVNFGNNTTSYALTYADTTPPQVTSLAVQWPQGIYTGQLNYIDVTASDNVGVASIDLYYSLDGGPPWSIIQEGYIPQTPAQYGIAYPWTVDSTLPLTPNLYIKAVAKDASGNPATKTAGPYTVKDGSLPKITLVSPKGGEVWNMGSTYQIQWSVTSSKPISYVSVVFPDGHSQLLTATSTPSFAATTIPWTVPAVFILPSGQVRVEIMDTFGFTARDVSGPITFHDPSAPPPPPWTTPTAIASSTLAGQPQMATAKDGTVHLIYAMKHDSSQHAVTFNYQKLSVGVWSSPATVSISTQSADSQYGANYSIGGWSLAVDSHGYPRLVWQADYGAGIMENSDDIYYSESNGSTWSSPQNLSSVIQSAVSTTTLMWAAGTAIPIQRDLAGAVGINGKVYVFAGASTYAYDPSSRQWAQMASLPSGTVSPNGAAGIGNFAYVLDYSGNLEIFDTVHNTWQSGAPLGTSSPVQLAAVNGKLYAVGTPTKMYDPASNQWTARTSMSDQRSWAAVAVIDTKIYVIDGMSGGAQVQTIDVYDTSADSWTTISPPGFTVNPWPRVQSAAAVAIGGKIYLFGGIALANGSSQTAATVWQFDPGQNTWLTLTSLATARYAPAVASIQSQIYVIGGTSSSSQSLSSVESGSVSSQASGAYSSCPRIAIDPLDSAQVVWIDGAYANSNGTSTGTPHIYSATKPSGQSWSAPQIIPNTDWANWVTTAIDSSGSPNVAYRLTDSSNVQHIFAGKLAASNWSSPQTVRSLANGGIGVPVLRAGPNNHLHLVWQESDYGQQAARIEYAFFDGTAWSANQLIYSSPSANSPTVVIDNQEQPHVLFEDHPDANGPVDRLLTSFKIGNVWSPPVQVNLNSQNVLQMSWDEAFVPATDKLHVVWQSNSGMMANQMTSASTSSAMPAISVTSPADASLMSIRSPLQISWTPPSGAGALTSTLDYSTDSWTTSQPIVSGLNNASSYSWIVPDLGTKRGQIRVTTTDTTGKTLVGYSGYFSTADLTPPIVLLTQPAIGQSLSINGPVTLAWSTLDNVAVKSVALDYSTDNKVTWGGIAANLASSGTYAWTAPATAGQVFLRATALDTASLAGTAVAGPFAVAAPNNPPAAPFNPQPSDQQLGVPTSGAVLGWTCSDPDGDPLTYTIHFGTSPTPPAVGTGSLAQYASGNLAAGVTYFWQIEASDGKSKVAGPVWSFTTTPPPPPPSIALPGQLDPGRVGVPYTATFAAVGGTPPSTWSLASGNLPQGMSFESTGATLTGTPTVAGQYPLTIKVTDSNGSSGTRGYQLSVASAPTRVIAVSGDLSFSAVPVGSSGPFKTLTISNSGSAPLTVSGITFPTGFAGNWNSGVISAGASQPVAVTFNPTSATSFGGAVTVSSDADAGNSALAVSGTGIVKPTLTVNGLTANSKVYDGTITATLNFSGATLGGVLPADAGNVTLVTSGATAAFSDKNVGTSKAVSVTGLALVGTAAGNYLLTPPSLTANIAPATLTVTANSTSRPYGNANPDFTATLSGFVNGETQAVVSGAPNLTTTATANSSVGTYPVVPGIGTLTAANYTFVNFVNGTLTITPGVATATPVFNPPSGTQLPQTISITSATSGVEIRYTLDGSDPSLGSPLYIGPLNQTAAVTIKARAFSTGLQASDVATANYLAVYHSADYRTNYWVIDGSEANRVLSYWRSTSSNSYNYHIEPSGLDGFAPGAGNTNGPRHSADYRAPFWFIDGTEMNRVLSYFRANGYHRDSSGLDGFAPNAGAGTASLADSRHTIILRQDAAATYKRGGQVTVNNRIDYSGRPLALLWRPRLPAGWQTTAVAGDGEPEISQGEIVWTGVIPPSPINMTYTVQVPPEEKSRRVIGGEVEWQFLGQANPATSLAGPAELVIDAEGSGFSQISEVHLLPNGQVQLKLRAETGRRFEVQVSKDLIHWESLCTLIGSDGAIEIAHPLAGSQASRFYRTRLLP